MIKYLKLKIVFGVIGGLISCNAFANIYTHLCFKNTDSIAHTITKVDLAASDWMYPNPEELWRGIIIPAGEEVCKLQQIDHVSLQTNDGVNFYFDDDPDYVRIYAFFGVTGHFRGYTLGVVNSVWNREEPKYTYLMGDFSHAFFEFNDEIANNKMIFGVENDENTLSSTFILNDYHNLPVGMHNKPSRGAKGSTYKTSCKIWSFNNGIINADCLHDPDSYNSHYFPQTLDYAKDCKPGSEVGIRAWGDESGGGAGTLYCVEPVNL